LSSVAGQALLHRNSGHGELAKAVESSGAGDPDIALTILEKTKDDVAREAIRSPEHICPPAMCMDEPPLNGSDPEAPIAVPEHSIRIDLAIRKLPIRIGWASKRMRFQFVAGELQESPAVHGN
jgi:hypothetical protein